MKKKNIHCTSSLINHYHESNPSLAIEVSCARLYRRSVFCRMARATACCWMCYDVFMTVYGA